jgi:hypothetical protein
MLILALKFFLFISGADWFSSVNFKVVWFFERQRIGGTNPIYRGGLI